MFSGEYEQTLAKWLWEFQKDQGLDPCIMHNEGY